MHLRRKAAVAVVALAHSNGHESRTVAECEKLPGTANRGERGACLACVQRTSPFFPTEFERLPG